MDSLAVSDVELSEELLLDNSLLDGRLVANCRTQKQRVTFGFDFIQNKGLHHSVQFNTKISLELSQQRKKHIDLEM